MEFLSVVMLSFVGCFIALIITLVFLNVIILMSDEDKPKTKVLTRGYDVPNKQDSQELLDAGKMSPIVGLKFNTYHQIKVQLVQVMKLHLTIRQGLLLERNVNLSSSVERCY